MAARTTHHDAAAELAVEAKTPADTTMSAEDADRLLKKHMDRWATLLERLK